MVKKPRLPIRRHAVMPGKQKLFRRVDKFRIVQKIASKSDTRVLSVTMHGNYPQRPGERKRFIIPRNVFIVFASRPGYTLYTKFVGEQLYRNITQSENEFKKFLLNRRNGPIEFSHWKSHVYLPGDYIDNMRLSPDTGSRNFRIKWLNSNNKNTSRTTLKMVSDTATKVGKNVIIFVASCRTTRQGGEFYAQRKAALVANMTRRINRGETVTISPRSRLQQFTPPPMNEVLRNMQKLEKSHFKVPIWKRKWRGLRIPRLNEALKKRNVKRPVWRRSSVARARRASLSAATVK